MASRTPSPRRPAQPVPPLTPRRPVGSPPATTSSRLTASVALATQDTLLAATAPSSSSTTGSNPHVQAIQSRVAELVRRYDESVASVAGSEDDDDDDDSHASLVPARWRVGDMLLATHASLAKTSTRVERSMDTEFPEHDAEVAAALDGGDSVAEVIHAAARTAAQTQAVLAKSLQVVQQLQHSHLAHQLHAVDASDGAARATQLRDLKITVEALHKEKAMVLAQLHDHAKAQKEMVALLEEQNQELKKSQIAMAMKSDELKTTREDFSARLQDLQKMNDTSQQTAATWRDKFQATLKTLGESEAKALELEKKNQSVGEEVVKHEFVLRTKHAEMDKLKERLKESEAARTKAEAALKEAQNELALKRQQDAAPKPKPVAAPAANNANNSKAMQEMEATMRQQARTIADLQARLGELTHTRSKFEEDNNELARIVRELQAKAQEVLASKPPSVMSGVVPSSLPKTPPPVVRRSTSFALSLKREPSSRRRQRRSSVGSAAQLGRRVSDDLSTSSSEDEAVDPETAEDERELNESVQHVVTLVFPARVSPLEQHSDEVISHSIALFEQDPTSHRPLTAATTSSELAESVEPTPVVSSTDSVEQLRMAHADELARLKKHYVTTLLEYKTLVIEQYERRQHEIQQHHKLEIENLILLVQAKFKRELERRGECVMQAKESLKLLYRAMQAGVPGGAANARLQGLLETGDDEDGDHDDQAPPEEPVPLKSILRAAVFAMSSSKQRNQQALDTINDIYGTVHSKNNSPRKPFVNVRVKNPKRSAQREPEPVAASPETTNADTDWGAFIKSMRANRDEAARGDSKAKTVAVHVGCQVDDRDFVIFDLKGLRGSHVSPENMEQYVLPSSALFGTSTASEAPAVSVTMRHVPRSSDSRDRGDLVCLNSGAQLDESVVAELRAVLPFLPPGSYYLSSTLRHQLLLEMMRFYADLGRTQQSSPHHNRRERDAAVDAVEVTIGSPRDTPFLRRKAVEAVDRRRRGESLSNSAMAMLQPPPQWTAPTKRAPGLVSHLASPSPPAMTLSHVRHRDF